MASLELVPLLKIQRELLDLPRGMGRFREYLRKMTGGTDDIVLPLGAFNPMSREHVAVQLDALIEMGAESAVAEALRRAEAKAAGMQARFKLGLVLADDAAGGWTHRFLTEAQHRFDWKGEAKRGWVTILLWTSETPRLEGIREEALATAYRTLHVHRFGWPETVGETLRCEGRALVFAGASGPVLAEPDRSRVRQLIQPRLESTHFPVLFTCLYGDRIAQAVGYDALGLPDHAGYALARIDALAGARAPETFLTD